MTAEPNEPVEPPNDAAAALPQEPEFAAAESDDAEPNTDAMGIDESDPVDAALVGEKPKTPAEPPD